MHGNMNVKQKFYLKETFILLHNNCSTFRGQYIRFYAYLTQVYAVHLTEYSSVLECGVVFGCLVPALPKDRIGFICRVNDHEKLLEMLAATHSTTQLHVIGDLNLQHRPCVNLRYCTFRPSFIWK
jgi:hypothetical protein